MNTTNSTLSATLVISAGDTAWMLTSSAFVMLMTPGLAFFYGGLVRHKNVINTMMMSFLTLGVVSLQWFFVGYSFAFGGNVGFFGNFEHGVFIGVGVNPDGDYAPTIPHYVFCVYEMMFAIITPAIISGAIVERMKFTSYLIFILLWTTIVYDAVAHWIWSAWTVTLEDGTTQQAYGWLRALGSIDFAGGTAVHISSAVGALVAAIIVGPRPDLDTSTEVNSPANVSYVLLGGALLWFGWFGFNSGSALASSSLAGLAFINTQMATAAGMTVWLMLDMIFKRESCAVGAVSGAVVGLVAITPAAGYVHVQSSVGVGIIATIVVYAAVKLKSKVLPTYLLDDSLDVFTCHGVGGIMGCILTGLFASTDANPGGSNGAFFGNPILLAYQLAAVFSTIGWSAAVTALILLPLKFTLGLVVNEKAILVGLDKHIHGNVAFHGIVNMDLNPPSSDPVTIDTGIVDPSPSPSYIPPSPHLKTSNNGMKQSSRAQQKVSKSEEEYNDVELDNRKTVTTDKVIADSKDEESSSTSTSDNNKKSTSPKS